jgi:carbon monoxide dehydrogenase subunit G
MAFLYRECTIGAPAAEVWAILREPPGVARAFAGVLVDTTFDAASNVRTVTFANGNVVQERIVTIDDARWRLAYAVIGGRFEHHHASMQIAPLDAQHCRFIWMIDFVPDELESFVTPLVDAGCTAIARNLSH